MAHSAQQQQQPVQRLVEEKHYAVPFEEGSPLVRRALSHALGVEFEELAPGMWFSTKKADNHSFLEITVRTLAVDDGTTVEVLLEHRYTPKAITLFVLGILLGCFLLLPLIPTIMINQKLNRQHMRQRLVEMHRAWTEIGHAVGAPRKSSYREQPRRAYEPARIATPPAVSTQSKHDAASEVEREAEAELALAASPKTAAR